MSEKLKKMIFHCFRKTDCFKTYQIAVFDHIFHHVGWLLITLFSLFIALNVIILHSFKLYSKNVYNNTIFHESIPNEKRLNYFSLKKTRKKVNTQIRKE